MQGAGVTGELGHRPWRPVRHAPGLEALLRDIDHTRPHAKMCGEVHLVLTPDALHTNCTKIPYMLEVRKDRQLSMRAGRLSSEPLLVFAPRGGQRGRG